MRVVDLFSGCGGMSLGLEQAGFNVVGAFDNWDPAIAIYKENFRHPIFKADLSCEEARSSVSQLKPDLIAGGPPCQDYSIAGKRKLGKTDAYGGEYMTPEGIKKADEQNKKFEEITKKLEAYLAAHPDGKLYAHFAGVWRAGAWDDVRIRLDDIEDKEVLRELEEVGIESDYRLERWSGSKEAGENAEKQLKEALEALKKKALKWNKEERLLMTKYRPEIEVYSMFTGMIGVKLECDTPWYQGVSTEEMEKDRELAISLFEKYIGKYEFVTFFFPV